MTMMRRDEGKVSQFKIITKSNGLSALFGFLFKWTPDQTKIVWRISYKYRNKIIIIIIISVIIIIIVVVVCFINKELIWIMNYGPLQKKHLHSRTHIDLFVSVNVCVCVCVCVYYHIAFIIAIIITVFQE